MANPSDRRKRPHCPECGYKLHPRTVTTPQGGTELIGYECRGYVGFSLGKGSVHCPHWRDGAYGEKVGDGNLVFSALYKG